MKKILFAISLIAVMFISACSDSSTSSTSNDPPGDAMQLPAFETSISPNHPDFNASSVNAIVSSLGFYFLFIEAYANIGDLNWDQNGNSWTYSQTSNGLTISITITESGDSYIVTMHMKGTMDGETVDADLAKATYKKDGSSGEWHMFDISENPVYEIFGYSWSVASNGTLSATATVYSESSVVEFVYQVTLKTDKSGTYTMKDGNSQLIQEAAWNVDGSGSLTIYDSQGGSQTFNWGPNPA